MITKLVIYFYLKIEVLGEIYIKDFSCCFENSSLGNIETRPLLTALIQRMNILSDIVHTSNAVIISVS